MAQSIRPLGDYLDLLLSLIHISLYRQARRLRGLLGLRGPLPGQGLYLPELGGARCV